jgi:hypothetical protein
VTQLANDGSAYFDGKFWWYYQANFETFGGVSYTSASDACQPCVQAPDECGMEVNRMAGNRAVRIDTRAAPTGPVISMVEVARLVKLIENSRQHTNVPVPGAAEPRSTT